MLEDQYKTWTTTEGQAIHVVHPPPQSLELAPNGEVTRQPLVATTYIDALLARFTKSDYIKLSDLSLVCKQHNYTNLFCQTMGKQLTRIEEAVNTFKDRTLTSPVTGPSMTHPISIKPPLEVTNFKLKASNTKFMDTLLQKMKTLNVQTGHSEPSGGSIHTLRSDPSPDENLSPAQIHEIQ